MLRPSRLGLSSVHSVGLAPYVGFEVRNFPSRMIAEKMRQPVTRYHHFFRLAVPNSAPSLSNISYVSTHDT